MAKLTSASAAAAGLAPLNLTEIKPGQLTVFNEIGQGRFKTVSSGRHNRHGLCAILRYKADSTRNEAHILSILSCGGSTHIPEVYGVQVERAGLTLAQEFSTFGSMRSVLQDPEFACMVTPGHKLHVAVQLADAVSFLESMRVVHTDLACRNFLVFKLEQEPENTKVKITDFMNALCLPANANHIVKKMPQATRWCAPETIASNKWSCKTDVWSLGAALWELFVGGEVPWKCHSKRSDVAKKLREIAFDLGAPAADLSDDFPAPASALLSAAYVALLSCLQPHPNARPSAKQLTAAFKQILKDPHKEPEIGQAQATTNVVAASLPAQTYEEGVSRPALIVPPQGVTVIACPSMRHREIESGPRLATPTSQESLAKAFESNQHTPTSACVTTPPTRCPSTPEEVRRVSFDSRRISFDSECPDHVLRASKVPYEGPLPSLLSHQVSQKMANLQNIKACLSSPDKNNADLGNLKEFLSCPEAVCGLDAENLISLRRKVAAAQHRQDSKSYVSQIHGPVYDTIVPLTRVTDSWYQTRCSQ